MSKEGRLDWDRVLHLTQQLLLPEIVEVYRGIDPCLLAHGKLLAWWDCAVDAPGFSLPPGERDFLIAADPDVFFVTSVDMPSNQVLARPHRVSERWIQAHLLLCWRALAPQIFGELFPGEGPPVPSFSSS